MQAMSDADVRLAHVVDDYEKLRTSAYRGVRQQVDLLGDALHAIRHERLAVADEFVDRALLALTKVRDELRHAPEEER